MNPSDRQCVLEGFADLQHYFIVVLLVYSTRDDITVVPPGFDLQIVLESHSTLRSSARSLPLKRLRRADQRDRPKATRDRAFQPSLLQVRASV